MVLSTPKHTERKGIDMDHADRQIETDRFNAQVGAFITLADAFIAEHYDGRPNYEAAADHTCDTVELIGMDPLRALALRARYMALVG